LLAVAALKHAEASSVIARDVVQPPLELALCVGANRVELDGAGEDRPDVDAAIECSGTARGFAEALERTRHGGRIVQLGLMPSSESSVDVNRVVAAELEIAGAFRFDDEIFLAVQLLSVDRNLDDLIATTFPIERATDAFASASDDARPGKVLLEI